jgi:hypothetical protein
MSGEHSTTGPPEGRVVRCLPHSPTFDRYIGYGRYRTWGRLGYSRRSLASPPQAVLGEEPRESFVTVAGRERYKSRFVSGASDQGAARAAQRGDHSGRDVSTL